MPLDRGRFRSSVISKEMALGPPVFLIYCASHALANELSFPPSAVKAHPCGRSHIPRTGGKGRPRTDRRSLGKRIAARYGHRPSVGPSICRLQEAAVQAGLTPVIRMPARKTLPEPLFAIEMRLIIS